MLIAIVPKSADGEQTRQISGFALASRYRRKRIMSKIFLKIMEIINPVS